MKKQIGFGLLASIIVIVLLGVFKFLQISKAIADSAKFAPPPDAVSTTKVKEEVWNKIIKAPASLTSVQGVVLSAEIPGKVTNIFFEPGEKVEAGKVLIELDVSVEEADLNSSLARLDFERRNYTRAKTLREKNANSINDLDDASVKLREAEAKVQSLKSTINRKKIVAPFAGEVGIRKVNVGQYLSAGTEVVPLYSLNPLYANFTLSENNSSEVKKGLKISLKVDSYDDVLFQGIVTGINPQIDENSRNIEVQATVENKDERLKPGMFSNIELVLPEQMRTIAVPVSSIYYAPYGDLVYVIEEMNGADEKTKDQRFLGARQQIVKLGEKRGDFVQVLSGLKVGEEIATTGVFKLRPNVPVKINNEVLPNASYEPKVENK